MELDQNLCGKSTYNRMHLSTFNTYFVLWSTDSMVGATLDPYILKYFIDYLDSFLQRYAPRREYSIMLGTTRPTSIMKAFLDPPRPPLFCACIGLDLLSLVGLEWLWVSAITVWDEADSELSVAELGSRQSDPKLLDLFPSVHGWNS